MGNELDSQRFGLGFDLWRDAACVLEHWNRQPFCERDCAEHGIFFVDADFASSEEVVD